MNVRLSSDEINQMRVGGRIDDPSQDQKEIAKTYEQVDHRYDGQINLADNNQGKWGYHADYRVGGDWVHNQNHGA